MMDSEYAPQTPRNLILAMSFEIKALNVKLASIRGELANDLASKSKEIEKLQKSLQDVINEKKASKVHVDTEKIVSLEKEIVSTVDLYHQEFVRWHKNQKTQ